MKLMQTFKDSKNHPFLESTKNELKRKKKSEMTLTYNGHWNKKINKIFQSLNEKKTRNIAWNGVGPIGKPNARRLTSIRERELIEHKKLFFFFLHFVIIFSRSDPNSSQSSFFIHVKTVETKQRKNFILVFLVVLIVSIFLNYFK